MLRSVASQSKLLLWLCYKAASVINVSSVWLYSARSDHVLNRLFISVNHTTCQKLVNFYCSDQSTGALFVKTDQDPGNKPVIFITTIDKLLYGNVLEEIKVD